MAIFFGTDDVHPKNAEEGAAQKVTPTTTMFGFVPGVATNH